MALVNRGRLSVQRIDEDAWEIIQNMAERGGWEDMEYGKGGKGKSRDDDRAQDPQGKAKKEGEVKSTSAGRKRKAVNVEDEGSKPKRCSTRARK